MEAKKISSSINISLEDSWLIMQFLRTLSDEIWQEYEKELLNKLNQFCHKQAFIWSDGLFEDDIPF